MSVGVAVYGTERVPSKRKIFSLVDWLVIINTFHVLMFIIIFFLVEIIKVLQSSTSRNKKKS